MLCWLYIFRIVHVMSCATQSSELPEFAVNGRGHMLRRRFGSLSCGVSSMYRVR